MSAGKLKKRLATKRQLLFSVVIGVVLLLIVFSLAAFSITPVKYEIAVGEVAPATITASRDITDDVSTAAAQEAARADVSDMYTLDDSVTDNVSQHMKDYFNNAANAALMMQDAYVEQKVNSGGYGVSKENYQDIFVPAEVDWENFLTEEIKESVRSMLSDSNMPDAAIYELASMDDTDIAQMAFDAAAPADAALENGIRGENFISVKNGLEQEIKAKFGSAGADYLAFYPVGRYLQANMILDEASTLQAREAAAEKVQPVMYKQNQTIVVAGEVVTGSQLAVLTALGVVGGEEIDYMLYVGTLLLFILVFAAYGVYLFQFDSEVLADTRKLIVLASIILVTAAIAVPLARLDVRIVPTFLGTMLACVLVSQRSALALNILMSFIVGTICSWNTGLLSETMVVSVMASVIGGSAAVFALYKPGYRASMIFAGLIAGTAGFLVVLLAGVVGTANAQLEPLLIDGAFAMGSGLLAGVIAIGTMPIWEALFRISTPSKLLELSNPNHPLLKRLSIEAPGTYHHSIQTANLAEAGADAVGANALLCRVGAYYHDVGKLKNPRLFKENQKGENPHDKLDPRESVKIIAGHIPQGLELAQKYKLPRDVQRIMAQHHGDGIVPFFFHKAAEAGLEPDEAAFRYRGTKPSTKEAAIVMLADCVEAAVKSMDDPDRDQVKDMIDKLMNARYNDGQLDESPLNRRDMNTLAKAFLSVFDGAFYERIKYPGQE